MTRRTLFTLPLGLLSKPLTALALVPRFAIRVEVTHKWFVGRYKSILKSCYILQDYGTDWAILAPYKYNKHDLFEVWQGSKQEAEQVCKRLCSIYHIVFGAEKGPLAVPYTTRIITIPKRFWKF